MENQSEIKIKVSEALAKIGSDNIPINVEKICKLNGIIVRRVDLTPLEKKYDRRISGLIYVDKAKNDKQILVNQEDIETRQNFTIAHELGHYYLHIPKDNDGIVISFRGAKNPEEREADVFAVSLLMPKKLVDKVYNDIAFPTAKYLAMIFGVSKKAMEYRLAELGLSYIG